MDSDSKAEGYTDRLKALKTLIDRKPPPAPPGRASKPKSVLDLLDIINANTSGEGEGNSCDVSQVLDAFDDQNEVLDRVETKLDQVQRKLDSLVTSLGGTLLPDGDIGAPPIGVKTILKAIGLGTAVNVTAALYALTRTQNGLDELVELSHKLVGMVGDLDDTGQPEFNWTGISQQIDQQLIEFYVNASLFNNLDLSAEINLNSLVGDIDASNNRLEVQLGDVHNDINVQSVVIEKIEGDVTSDEVRTTQNRVKKIFRSLGTPDDDGAAYFSGMPPYEDRTFRFSPIDMIRHTWHYFNGSETKIHQGGSAYSTWRPDDFRTYFGEPISTQSPAQDTDEMKRHVCAAKTTELAH